PGPVLSLAKTLYSGQVFHWEKLDAGFIGAIGDRPVYVEQRGESLLASSDEKLVRNYIALDHPLSKICASFPDDAAMNAARAFCRGLRIIRQPKWECLATFICSSMKQVAHIRQISRKLRERFGERRKIDNHVVLTFPSADRLAASSEKELRECALGYRAKNLLSQARHVPSANVRVVTARKICWREPDRARPARSISRSCRSCPMPIFARGYVSCRAWAQRLLIACGFSPMSGCARSRH